MVASTDPVGTTIQELRECLLSHEPDVRILGNVRVADAMHAIDTILTLAQRYSVLRQQGVHPVLVIAGVRITIENYTQGADLDRHTDRERSQGKTKCPRNFWCVHEVLCPGARRIA